MSRMAARETAVCLAYAKSMGTAPEIMAQDRDAAVESETEQWQEIVKSVQEAFRAESAPLGNLRPEDIAYVRRGFTGVEHHMDELDGLIQQHAIDWKVERMPRVDLAVLRVAVYEILYERDLPESISANEAVECAKKFGGTKSPVFVNGVLSGILKSERVQH